MGIREGAQGTKVERADGEAIGKLASHAELLRLSDELVNLCNVIAHRSP